MKLKTLNNVSVKQHDDFVLGLLKHPSRERRAIIAASDPLRQELVETGLGILCERAFTLMEGLRLRRLAREHGVMSLGNRLDAFGRVNTLRQLLVGHGIMTGPCFGVRIEAEEWPYMLPPTVKRGKRKCP